VLVGGYVYVGGLSFPGRTFDDKAREAGRVIRFPIEGGEPTEVWRGQWFRPPLKAHGDRIAFAELAPTNRPSYRTFAGLHLIDTRNDKVIDVSNLPGRDYVLDFALVADELVFSSGSDLLVGPDGKQAGLPGSPIVRYRFDEGSSREVFVHPTSTAKLFVRDGRIEAFYLADKSSSGYDDPIPKARFELEPAVFALGVSGVTLTRRFTEIPRRSEDPYVDYAVVHADESSYFVSALSATSNGSITTRRYPVRPGANPISVGGPSNECPVFDAGDALSVSSLDRSAIRRVNATAATESLGDEVAFDARRQVYSISVDACRIAWLSQSSSSPETYRLTVGARP
jgi:hypothetical protein